MKKIYTFTLKGDDYPLDKFASNLRLFAHMLYSAVYNYDGDYDIPLNIDKNIIYNNIHEGNNRGGYYLDSDIYDEDVINYEPFIAGDNTFGFTINEDLISREVINDLVNYIKRLLKLDYEITINTFDYIVKDNNDEKNRRKTIRLVFNKLGCRINKKRGFTRRLSPSIKRRMV